MNYREMVLSHLLQLQQLPKAAQAEIAARVTNFLQMARAATNEVVLSACASAAAEEQAKAIERRASILDPSWAAPALAEAWCYARLSFFNGHLERAEALAIIEAVEAFASGAKR